MPRQYPPEFRLRALRLFDTLVEDPEVSEFDAIRSVASKLGVSQESVRRWRRKAQVDAGQRPGTSSSEHAEIRRLKREVAELRRANEVLRQYFPKGTDLSRWSAQEIEAVAHARNTRPRKTLGWKTPAEAFNEQLLLLQQVGVASTT